MGHALAVGNPLIRGCTVVLLLLGGCSFHNIAKQPDYWQTRIRTNGQECPDISGTFANSNGIPPELFLYDDIRGKPTFDLGGSPFNRPLPWQVCLSCRVAIEWRDEDRTELEVRSLSHAYEDVDKLTLRRDQSDFDCKDGLLMVPFSIALEFGIAGRVGRGTRAYSMANDGSLIRRENFTFYWHTDFVIPGVTTAEHDARWPAVPRSDSDKSSPPP